MRGVPVKRDAPPKFRLFTALNPRESVSFTYTCCRSNYHAPGSRSAAYDHRGSVIIDTSVVMTTHCVAKSASLR